MRKKTSSDDPTIDGMAKRNPVANCVQPGYRRETKLIDPCNATWRKILASVQVCVVNNTMLHASSLSSAICNALFESLHLSFLTQAIQVIYPSFSLSSRLQHNFLFDLFDNMYLAGSRITRAPESTPVESLARNVRNRLADASAE